MDIFYWASNGLTVSKKGHDKLYETSNMQMLDKKAKKIKHWATLVRFGGMLRA